MKLTTRLVITAVGLVLMSTVLIAFATSVAMHDFLLQRLDRSVLSGLQRLPPDMTYGERADMLNNREAEQYDYFFRKQQPGTLAGAISPDGVCTCVVSTETGEIRAISQSAAENLNKVPLDGRTHTVNMAGLGDYRVLADGRELGFRVFAGLPTSSVDSAVSSLIWWEALFGLSGVVLAATIGTFVVRRQLAPLREVANTAHQVTAMRLDSGEVDLTPRVARPDPATEVGQVGAALNSLLEHVEQSLSARHRSEQQVRQFVADASHELRTPLATIKGYAELSRLAPPDPATRAETLGTSMTKVETEADRMSRLVDDLLLLARLDSGRALVREPVDLTRLLLESCADARVLCTKHHWRLDLPDEPIEIIGDEHRLNQVFTNLMNNARKHTPVGTTVQIAARRLSPDSVEVTVTDDGPGFPAELAPVAFDRFTRGDAARTRGRDSGAGLGLSIVSAIVGAHGGDVSLDLAASGCRIVMHLPVGARPEGTEHLDGPDSGSPPEQPITTG